MELEFRRQYFANATKALQMEKKNKNIIVIIGFCISRLLITHQMI
jgi:hypothetical protein